MNVPPNIVFLLSDQHRADVLGAAGHAVVQTPNLDALAAAGTVFDRAYCQGPLCVPARVSLLTERYVRDHGARQNRIAPRAGMATMVQAIRAAGYHTAAIGKMHLYPHPADVADGVGVMRGYGFDEADETGGKLASRRVTSAYTRHLEQRGLLEPYRDYMRAHNAYARSRGGAGLPPWSTDPSPLPAADYLDTWTGRRAAAWIDNRAGSQPFFLWAGFPGPHDPWDAPAEYVARYRDAAIPVEPARRPELPADGPLRELLSRCLAASGGAGLTAGRIAEVRRHYYANVTVIDEAIGAIMAALRRRGLDGSTWVIYSTDHGEMLGSHGLLHKMVCYEPAVRVPLIIRPPGGGPARRLAGLTEHVDLSATLLAIAGAGPLPGSAGRSLLPAVAGQAPAGREYVVSENLGFGMFRTERHKLVVWEPDAQPVQLFDLAADPAEDDNLLASPAGRAIAADLMHRLVRPFLQEEAA